MTSPYNIDALRTDTGYRFAPITFIQGAVACGHTAHLQTEHGTVAFRPYNITEIRTYSGHRAGEVVFPGEEIGQNWLVEFYPTGHNHGDEIELRSANAVEVARFAHFYLNGMDRVQDEAIQEHGYKFPTYSANHGVSVWCNQAERDGTVLAVIDNQILVEVEMPGTTSQWGFNRRTGRYLHPARPSSFLAQYTVSGRDLISKKNYSYTALPKRWLAAVKAAEMTDWIGMGQRSIERIPFPTS